MSSALAVPPHDERFIGAGDFDEPLTPGRPRGPGCIVVREERVIAAQGNRTMAEVGGIELQILHASTNRLIGDPVGPTAASGQSRRPNQSASRSAA